MDMGNTEINDPTGNNNGRIDPGETVDIIVSLMNVGIYDVTNIVADFSTADTYTTINNGSLNFSDIPPGETEDASMNISVSENAPIGHIIYGTLFVECLSNGQSLNYEYELNFKVGLTVEDFETGDFSAYEWEFGGDANWSITSSESYEGTYSAKSGAIGDESESELMLTMEVVADDEISFYYKVSSEATYDYLRFYIDGAQMGEWEGEAGWEQVTYPVTTGTHTFKWAYEKDQSVNNGDDCAWIDWIELPASDEGVGIGEDYNILTGNQLGSYPNPFTNQTRITFNVLESSIAQVKITDVVGHTVWSVMVQAEQGEQEVLWDGNNIEAGIYIVELFVNNELKSTRKLLKTK
jgi:hypothetical protein